MDSKQTEGLPAGYVVNDLYEIISKMSTDSSTISYLANHKLRNIHVRLRILKPELRRSTEEFQSFMQEIQQHKNERRLMDYGILIDGLIPYAVYNPEPASNT